MNTNRKTFHPILEAAENIRNQIIESVGYYNETEQPTLDLSGDYPRIVWEAGPFEWTTNDRLGLTEELAPMYEEFGITPKYDARPYWIDPAGFHAEAENHYSLTIYED